jgi:hypothetical protein
VTDLIVKALTAEAPTEDGGSDKAMRAATSRLAGLFASIYLVCEVGFKLMATVLPRCAHGALSAIGEGSWTVLSGR